MQGMKKLEDIFNHEGKAADDLLNIAKVSLILKTRGCFFFLSCLFCLFVCFLFFIFVFSCFFVFVFVFCLHPLFES